jgi:hypothetical protein
LYSCVRAHFTVQFKYATPEEKAASFEIF